MKQVNDISEWGLTRIQKEYPEEGMTHALWETTNKRFAIYFYKIGEFGIMKTCSRLQILKDKSDPHVIYDSQSVIFDCNVFDWSFLKNNLTDKGYLILWQLKFDPFRKTLILINLETCQFTSWDKSHANYSLNTDKSITFVETFFNDKDNSQSSVTENYKLDEIAWRPLNALTS